MTTARIVSGVPAFVSVVGARGRGPVSLFGGQASWEQLLPTDPQGTATLTFIGLPVGVDIVVLTAGAGTIRLQVDEHGATSYAYTYDYFSVDTIVDVGFIKPGYVPFYIRGLTLPVVNAVLPVALTPDRNFS